MRFAALPAAVPWLVYLLWRHWRRPLLVVCAVAGLLVPLGAYAGEHASATGRLGFTDASGLYLYSRVAYIADCSKMHVPAGTRSLCQPGSQRVKDPSYYVWQPTSPDRKLFPGWGATPNIQHHRDGVLRKFAVAAIEARPFAYLGLAGDDFLRFFTPGKQSGYTEAELHLPAHQRSAAGSLAMSVWPSFRNETRWPAPLLYRLGKVFRTPRWLLAATTLLGLVELLVVLVRAIMRRAPLFPRRMGTLLFLGMPLATLVAAAGTAEYGLRYIAAVAPLLFVGGALAVEDALGELSSRRATASPDEGAEVRGGRRRRTKVGLAAMVGRR
jgi:hypothetical protein